MIRNLTFLLLSVKKPFLMAVAFTTISSIFMLLEVLSTQHLVRGAVGSTYPLAHTALVVSVYILSYFFYYTRLQATSRLNIAVRRFLGNTRFSWVLSSSEIHNSREVQSEESSGSVYLSRIPIIIRNASMNLDDAIYELVFVLVGICFLAFINTYVGLVCLAFAIFSFGAGLHQGTMNRKYIKKTPQLHTNMCISTTRLLRNKGLHLSFDLSSMSPSSLHVSTGGFLNASHRASLYSSNCETIHRSINQLREITVLLIIGLSPGVDLSAIFVCLFISNLISVPFQRLGSRIEKISSSLSLLTACEKEYQEIPSVARDLFPSTPPSFNKLSYESQCILTDGKAISRNISFDLTMGTRILVNGRSGSGKSTLIKSFLVEDVHNGTTTLNGKVVSDPSALFPYVTWIEQDSELLPGSIQDNVTLYANEVDVDQLRRATSFIDHNLDRDAASLSGGEAQQVMLARAFYLSKPVLVADESLSCISDSKSEEVIRKLLSEYPGAILFVEHRPPDSVLSIVTKTIQL